MREVSYGPQIGRSEAAASGNRLDGYSTAGDAVAFLRLRNLFQCEHLKISNHLLRHVEPSMWSTIFLGTWLYADSDGWVSKCQAAKCPGLTMSLSLQEVALSIICPGYCQVSGYLLPAGTKSASLLSRNLAEEKHSSRKCLRTDSTNASIMMMKQLRGLKCPLSRFLLTVADLALCHANLFSLQLVDLDLILGYAACSCWSSLSCGRADLVPIRVAIR